MTESIDDVRRFIRAFLSQHGQPVPPKTATSEKEHLEVWIIGPKRRVAGLEMKHDGLVNIWVTQPNVSSDLPASVKVTRKTPKGRVWTDENGKGANSNLSAYDYFRTRRIACLCVTSIADARAVLTHLNR
jgi:hypothetical protein